MKMFYAISLLIFASLNLNAQNFVTNDGLALTLTGGLTATIQNGGYTNQTNGANLGTIDNEGTITLTGNWTNNAANTVFTSSSGTVQFIGTAAQTIGGSNSTDFYNLTINNTSATGVTLAAPVSVGGGTLTLNDGLLYTDNTNLLTLTAGSLVGAVSNSSFVSGPVAKTGTTDFTFPVGKDTAYRPVAVTSLSGSETFKAEYFHSDPNLVPYDVTSNDISLDHISRCEYWTVNRTGAQNAFVTLSWDTYSCGVDDQAKLAVARWDGTVWSDNGNGGTTGGPDPGTGTVITAAIVTAFSPFTLASTDGGNPLPIELLDFNALIQDGIVKLHWSTASEINNDFFTIEKTKNGVSFEKVATVVGSGNSTTLQEYSTIDENPHKGISYYRLKQTDFDGKYEYSKLVAVQYVKEEGQVKIFPNPLDGNTFYLRMNRTEGQEVLVALYNSLGEIVYSKVIVQQEGYSITSVDIQDRLSPGIYLVIGRARDELVRQKLIIK